MKKVISVTILVEHMEGDERQEHLLIVDKRKCANKKVRKGLLLGGLFLLFICRSYTRFLQAPAHYGPLHTHWNRLLQEFFSA